MFQVAKTSETFTTGFVDCAMTAHNRLLSIGNCKRLLNELDDELSDSVSGIG